MTAIANLSLLAIHRIDIGNTLLNNWLTIRCFGITILLGRLGEVILIG